MKQWEEFEKDIKEILSLRKSIKPRPILRIFLKQKQGDVRLERVGEFMRFNKTTCTLREYDSSNMKISFKDIYRWYEISPQELCTLYNSLRGAGRKLARKMVSVAKEANDLC